MGGEVHLQETGRTRAEPTEDSRKHGLFALNQTGQAAPGHPGAGDHPHTVCINAAFRESPQILV